MVLERPTIIELIKSSFDVGFYVNADDIEREIRDSGKFNISKYNIGGFEKTFLRAGQTALFPGRRLIRFTFKLNQFAFGVN